jgi:hypothetical protein
VTGKETTSRKPMTATKWISPMKTALLSRAATIISHE